MFLFTELTDKLLGRKVDLCTELLAAADILEPGSTRLRGLLLYDLQAAKLVKAKRDLASGKILKAAAQVSFCAWAETEFMIYFSSLLPVLLPHVFCTSK
jgi:hypothetical protein